jgi:uncharacterized protein (TIGR02646 family)
MVRTRSRPPAPDQLFAYAARWTARFERVRSGSQRGDWATATAKKTIGSALRGLAHGKCVYCEGPLEAQADLDIDHYVAKTVDPGLVFEWTNLLPSCRKCNRTKLDHDHANALLKPDIEDPEPFFWLHPDSGKLDPHPSLDAAARQRAEETIRLCDLQRPALCDQRIRMLGRVNRWLQLIVAQGLNHVLRQEWESLVDPRSEYKFVLRHALELHGQRELAEFDRQQFQSGALPS